LPDVPASLATVRADLLADPLQPAPAQHVLTDEIEPLDDVFTHSEAMDPLDPAQVCPHRSHQSLASDQHSPAANWVRPE
jgi:hypothetical protein